MPEDTADTPSHPAIESFLATLDAKLCSLPKERRASERVELAQHLALLVSAYRVRGLGPAEAAAAAIERFGRAEQIGHELCEATRTGPRSPAHYLEFFLAYGGFIVVTYLALFWSIGDPMPRHLPWVIAANALVLPVAFIYLDVRKRRKPATD
jgi:hypothetical protein